MFSAFPNQSKIYQIACEFKAGTGTMNIHKLFAIELMFNIALICFSGKSIRNVDNFAANHFSFQLVNLSICLRLFRPNTFNFTKYLKYFFNWIYSKGFFFFVVWIEFMLLQKRVFLDIKFSTKLRLKTTDLLLLRSPLSRLECLWSQ